MTGDMAILHHQRGPVARAGRRSPSGLRQNVPVVATQDGQVIRFDEYAEIFDIAVKVAKRLTCGVKRR